MVITRQQDALNKVEYRFSPYTSFGTDVSLYFNTYVEMVRLSKRHKWQPAVRWYRLDRRNSTLTIPPDVPQDVYYELISSIKFNPQFNVSNI